MATKESELKDYWKIIYRFDLFSKKFNYKHLILFVIMLYILEILVGYLFSTSVLFNSVSSSWLQSVILVPMVLFFVYFLFNIFLNAFGDTKKSFFEGFFIFIAITFLYIIVGQILVLLNTFLQSNLFSLIVSWLFIILSIYYIFNLVLNLKNYYNTNWQRILVSFVFVDVLIVIVLVFGLMSTLV